MKKMKFALVAAIVSLAMLSYAADIPDRPGRIVKISLEQAQTNPGLVKAMYDQLNDDFLELDKPVYYAIVKYCGKTFLIFGSKKAWTKFFLRNMRAKPQSIVGTN